MESKMTSSRVAFGLLCGLAVCCSVMYITADGSDEMAGETILADAPSVYGIGGPESVDSEDVQKAATIYTNTPDGRMRLVDYLNNIETEISAEEAARKRDVDAVREQMARNFAFNKNARKKLKKQLLDKMAKNAEKAHNDLKKAMAGVQKQFAQAADLANKRNKANIARSKALRKTMRENKRAAKKNLATAVNAQQKSMAALKSSMNERIDQTDASVAKNAAQIKQNAKDARKALQSAVQEFDQKVAAARSEAAAGRSKLAQQLKDQSKATKAWANNELKMVVEKTQAHFRRVRSKMAEDRAHADSMLKKASTRMTASLNAFTALNDKNFKKTVKDIDAAKKEAQDRVDAATTEFKANILNLRATVNEQVAKTNTRITQLSGVVEKNKLAQAKVNANVEAEMKRMVKLGNDRYAEHLKKDKELKGMIDANKEATDKRLKTMAAHYRAELGAVRATMKKNRAHASHMLSKESAKLYSAIAASERTQMEENEKLAAQTRAAKMDMEDALNDAKHDFAKRLGKLHATVVANDKKFEGKMDKLTGIVRDNAVKSAQGRKQLASVMAANKADLHSAVSDAVHKGEQRMMQAEQKLKDLNKETKASLNMRITSEITKLSSESHSQIEGLHLQSKAARAAMKKQLLYAVNSAAEEAKTNLADAVKNAKAAFTKAEADEEEANAAAAADRKAIQAKIDFEKIEAKRALKDAVGTMERSLLTLKTETRAKIKKTNKKITAYGKALKKEAKDVKALMESNMDMLTQKISDAQEATSKSISAADAKSAEGFKKAMGTIKDELKKDADASNAKFAAFYDKMAEQREELEGNLASATTDMNDSIAKQAALADARFSKTVKDLKAAREEAADQVADARKNFATSMASLESEVKRQETRMTGELEVVTTELADHKTLQTRVNRRVKGELNRVRDLVNDHSSKSAKARGKIKALLDENKRAASEMVEQLGELFQGQITKIRSKAAENSLEAARDLTAATTSMYGKLSEVQIKAAYENDLSAEKIATFETQAAKGIEDSKTNFNARLNQLTNVVSMNAKKVEREMEVLTGVIRSEKEAAAKDRELIESQNEIMKNDMQKRIQRAIQEGEAKAKRVALRATENLSKFKSSMLIEISERVEEMADTLFTTVQENHQKLADNYLSLKAYAVTAEDKLTDYVTKGKGKNLSSLGDLLSNVALLADVKVEKEEGIGMGSAELPAIFTGNAIKVDKSVSKINALVNEYSKVTHQVRLRWHVGLGKYLLCKLEESMMQKGVLQVDTIQGKSGNYVFMNGHAVGLSNKLNDFESLAVRMAAYESTLAKLTAALAGKIAKPKGTKEIQYVQGSEWSGK
jgi:hypothetical protein